jgi:hypothetical protein
VTVITQAPGVPKHPGGMFIVSLIMSLVGLARIAIGRALGYGEMPERPYRRVHGDAPGAWKPEER